MGKAHVYFMDISLRERKREKKIAYLNWKQQYPISAL